jgi:hypothetical protein
MIPHPLITPSDVLTTRKTHLSQPMDLLSLLGDDKALTLVVNDSQNGK